MKCKICGKKINWLLALLGGSVNWICKKHYENTKKGS